MIFACFTYACRLCLWILACRHLLAKIFACKKFACGSICLLQPLLVRIIACKTSACEVILLRHLLVKTFLAHKQKSLACLAALKVYVTAAQCHGLDNSGSTMTRRLHYGGLFPHSVLTLPFPNTLKYLMNVPVRSFDFWKKSSSVALIKSVFIK